MLLLHVLCLVQKVPVCVFIGFPMVRGGIAAFAARNIEAYDPRAACVPERYRRPNQLQRRKLVCNPFDRRRVVHHRTGKRKALQVLVERSVRILEHRPAQPFFGPCRKLQAFRPGKHTRTANRLSILSKISSRALRFRCVLCMTFSFVNV